MAPREEPASGPDVWGDRLAILAEMTGRIFWETNANLIIRVTIGSDPDIALALRGADLAELLGGDVAPGPRIARASIDMQRPFAGCEIERMVFGRPRLIEIEGRPVKRDGVLVGYAGTAADISELTAARRAEEQVRQGLIDAVNAFDGGVALFDANDRLILSNYRYFRGLYGADAMVELGLNFETLLDLALSTGLITDALGRESAWRSERMAYHRAPRGAFTLRLTDGRQLLISETRTRDGGTLVIHTDVTALVVSEMALRDQTQLLAATMESIGEGVLVCNEAGRLILANDYAVDLLEVTPDLLVSGQLIETLLPCLTPDPPPAHQALREPPPLFTPERLMQTYGVYQRSLHDAKILEIRHRPRVEGGCVITARDVTKRHRAELELRLALQQAEFANRAKSNFIATMSHELRTPLNAIIGFAEIIKDEVLGPLGDRRYLGYAHDIHISGMHLLDVINDILDLSKIESGRFELQEKPVDLGRLIRTTIRVIHERAQRGQVEIETHLPDPEPGLSGDERALKQILLNLISNAIKFTPPRGVVEVAVELETPSGDLLLRVADTGVGMAADDIPRALERFSQIGNLLTRSHQGTGLGLPLSKSLAELHGGALEITSTPGVGTTVTVRLPSHRVSPTGQRRRIDRSGRDFDGEPAT